MMFLTVALTVSTRMAREVAASRSCAIASPSLRLVDRFRLYCMSWEAKGGESARRLGAGCPAKEGTRIFGEYCKA